ncbi:MAG: hypothetical protein MUE73_17525 [Planctomycetes bacterium]|jgi:hypothetical protein|nr:hypothetical protein [Planctomycetota bacterium]
MASSPPPDFREKRQILFGDRASDEDRLRAAREFFDAARFGEALELLERAPDETLLSRVGEEATRRGDTFLLLRVEKILGRELPASAWLAAGRSAETGGRFLDAHRAYTRAGDTERAASLRATEIAVPETLRPENKDP